MNNDDTFVDLARYYDPIMEEVDYDRWLVVTTLLADLVPIENFTHLDVACGTGVLIKKLIQHGWRSYGVDLSPAMLETAQKGPIVPPVVRGNMCALPFHNAFEYATCVFDSLNFLLEPALLSTAMRQIGDALKDGGILYFDLITERMVTENFADQKWTERNGNFSTTWNGVYDRKSGLAKTAIQVNSGPVTIIRERIHDPLEVEIALRGAGLTLLGAFDATNWGPPTRKTERLEMVAVKGDDRQARRAFRKIRKRIQEALA